MSKNPAIKPQSDDDAATMAAADAMLGGGEAPAVVPTPQAAPTVAELAKAEKDEKERLEKADMAAADQAKPAGQDAADGGQQQPIAKACKKSDSEGEEDEDMKEAEEEETKKSVTEEDLLKAIDIAESLVTDAAPEPDRRAILGEKLSKGEITDDEQAELVGLLSKSDDGRTLTERALEDPDIAAQVVADEFDVSAFLARHASFVAGAMDEFSDNMSKSFDDVRRNQSASAKVSVALAKSVLEQSRLIKSLEGRLHQVEEAPQPRVGIPTSRALHKSSPVTGDSPGWNRDQIVGGLVALQRSSDDGKSPSGRDIAYDTAEFETSGMLHPAMKNDLSKVLG